MKERINVTMFSGGRGTASITEQLSKHPQVNLTLLINAYDDGLSTGRLREFIPGMLGPSDIRKNISRLISDSDPSLQGLKEILEYRFPKDGNQERIIQALRSIVQLDEKLSFPDLAVAFGCVSLAQARVVSGMIGRFLQYYEQMAAQGIRFDFRDCSLGNLLFAGCYLESDRDFNRASEKLSYLCEINAGVINITDGECLTLFGVKEDGTYLSSEAEIVSEQNRSPIKEIFLLRERLSEDEIRELRKLPLAQQLSRLDERSTIPKMSLQAREALRSADIIIYGPGTQHSSLFPSYLCEGVVETIAANTAAEKFFISNIHRDHDLQGEDTASLLRKLKFYLSRSGRASAEWNRILTAVFFQQMEANSEKSIGLKSSDLDASGIPILVLDWGAKSGMHSGPLVLREITAAVNQRLHKKLNSFHTSVSIVVPTFNNEETIKGVLQELRLLDLSGIGMTKEIILADGGSSDRTLEIARQEKDIRIIESGRTLKRGELIRGGLKEAQSSIIVTFPGNHEYDSADLIEIVKTLKTTEYSAVFGSRLIKCLNLPEQIMRIYQGNRIRYFISKYGGLLLSALCWVVFNRFINDPLTEIKAFDANVLRDLKLSSNGVDLEIEIIKKLSRRNVYILEIPVRYNPRTNADGRRITIRDGLRCLVSFLNFSWKGRSSEALDHHPGLQ